MNKKCIKKHCSKYQRYGSYCFKHRNLYLLDNNNIIITHIFTTKEKDYFKKDLKKYYQKNIDSYCPLNKAELFIEVEKIFVSLRLLFPSESKLNIPGRKSI